MQSVHCTTRIGLVPGEIDSLTQLTFQRLVAGLRLVSGPLVNDGDFGVCGYLFPLTSTMWYLPHDTAKKTK